MERRCGWTLILCFILIMMMTLMGYMHFKKEEINKMVNELEFSEAALREAAQGVKNYNFVVEQAVADLDTAEQEVKVLLEEVEKLKPENEHKINELQACKNSQAALTNEIADLEKEMADIAASFAGEKTNWSEEMNTLAKQFQDTSPLCDHVKDDFASEPSLKDLCPQLELRSQIVPKI